MSGLHIPSREQHLLELYSKDFILMFEFEGLLKSVTFEKEPFAFNLALSRLSLRFADMVRSNALFPRLKGVFTKTLVENAWLWSKAEERVKRLKNSGISCMVNDGSAFRLSTLDGIPRKILYANVVVAPEDLSKASKLLDKDVSLSDRIFRVRTLAKEPDFEGFVDRSSACQSSVCLIPSIELQFLILCSNNIFALDGNVFNGSSLQWVMDAVDMVRRNPDMNFGRVACLAETFAQTATLKLAVDSLKAVAPSVFQVVDIPYKPLSKSEKKALALHERYLFSDQKCRENQGSCLYRRFFLRLRCNWYDMARYNPITDTIGLLFMSPGYYRRKYLKRAIYKPQL